jgi:hypothetical protein
MSPAEEEAPRETLTRLAERFRLTKPTLRLIAQADNPTLTDTDVPDERQIAQVNSAIEVFVLAGLDSDPLIAAAITRAREQGAEHWRDQLWKGLLADASAEWELRGRPEHPLAPRLATVPPIPPQPAEEINSDEHPGHSKAA